MLLCDQEICISRGFMRPLGDDQLVVHVMVVLGSLLIALLKLGWSKMTRIEGVMCCFEVGLLVDKRD